MLYLFICSFFDGEEHLKKEGSMGFSMRYELLNYLGGLYSLLNRLMSFLLMVKNVRQTNLEMTFGTMVYPRIFCRTRYSLLRQKVQAHTF